MSTCDLCGEKKGNVTMYMAEGRLKKSGEYAIRRKIESMTGKQIPFMPHLCSECFKEYSFAEILRSTSRKKW